MDGRPNRRNKATFSNFSGAVLTEPDLAATFLLTLQRLVTFSVDTRE